MADIVQFAKQHIARALQVRDSADISWIQPPPAQSGWTLAADALRFLDALVRELKPKHVIEFGAGLSTKVLSRACVQMNSPCAITSVDHDPQFGVSDTLAIVESSTNLTLASQIAPLVARDYGGTLLPTYLWDAGKFAATTPADLVLIDGPPVDLGGREGVLYQVMEHCRPGTIVLLDDASRRSEGRAMQSWQQTFGDAVELQKLPHFVKGMAAVIVREIVKPSELWDRKLAAAKRIIESIVSPGAKFMLIERGNFGEFSSGKQALSLVCRDGDDWGPPENSVIAIEELRARIAEGATHFVLPWTSGWWVETYPELFAELTRISKSIHRDELVFGFSFSK